MKSDYKFATRAIHAGQEPDEKFGAVMQPIFQTTTYRQKEPGVYPGDYDYSRAGNPTRTALQENLASLENARFGLCFGSGQAAQDAILHLLSTGDHVILSDDVYGGTFRQFDKIYKQLGIHYTRVDLADLEAVKSAFTPKTKLLWLETPTNPLLKILDIEALATIAKKQNCLSVVDNTFASPYLQNPLELGADIVMHSTTKYIGGHSDVIGGALMTNSEELEQQLRFIQKSVGAVPSPWDCFLLLRSTKTLQIRMEKHCANAKQVVEFLSKHPGIEKTYYPGLPSHPNHAVAKQQMKDFGGMVTCVLKGGLPAAKSFLKNTRIFTLAESLGGVESLIEHPALMTHASIPPENRKKLGIDDGLVRLSIGIEDVEDLVADLASALKA